MKNLYILLSMMISYTYAQDPIKSANDCYQQKEYGCAVEQYKIALAEKKYKEKDYATIKHRIGVGLYELSKYNEANEAFLDAIKADSTFRAAYWDLGASYYSLKDYKRSIEYYKKTAELYTDDISRKNIYLGLGKVYNADKKYQDALNACEKALI